MISLDLLLLYDISVPTVLFNCRFRKPRTEMKPCIAQIGSHFFDPSSSRKFFLWHLENTTRIVRMLKNVVIPSFTDQVQ